MPSCTSTLRKVLNACAGQWLQVLQLLLQILEVPSTIITGVRSPFCLSMWGGCNPPALAAGNADQAAAPLFCAVVLSHLAGSAAGVTP